MRKYLYTEDPKRQDRRVRNPKPVASDCFFGRPRAHWRATALAGPFERALGTKVPLNATTASLSIDPPAFGSEGVRHVAH